jgi:hypothetical protein
MRHDGELNGHDFFGATHIDQELTLNLQVGVFKTG